MVCAHRTPLHFVDWFRFVFFSICFASTEWHAILLLTLVTFVCHDVMQRWAAGPRRRWWWRQLNATLSFIHSNDHIIQYQLLSLTFYRFNVKLWAVLCGDENKKKMVIERVHRSEDESEVIFAITIRNGKDEMDEIDRQNLFTVQCAWFV